MKKKNLLTDDKGNQKRKKTEERKLLSKSTKKCMVIVRISEFLFDIVLLLRKWKFELGQCHEKYMTLTK